MFTTAQLAGGYPARANVTDPLTGIGTTLHQTKALMKCVYSFAVLGGATGDILLLDDIGNAAILPVGAIVTNMVMNITTVFTSGGAATVALKLLNAADLMAAKTVSSAMSATGFTAGVPVGTAATWVGPVTAQVGNQVKATVATAALTAGIAQFFCEFVIQ